MFLVTVRAPEVDGEPAVDLEFHVALAPDLSVGITDLEQSAQLDKMMDEGRGLILKAFFVTEERPDVVSMATWFAADHRVEGLSMEAQQRIAEKNGSKVFKDGTYINASAWAAREGGIVV